MIVCTVNTLQEFNLSVLEWLTLVECLWLVRDSFCLLDSIWFSAWFSNDVLRWVCISDETPLVHKTLTMKQSERFLFGSQQSGFGQWRLSGLGSLGTFRSSWWRRVNANCHQNDWLINVYKRVWAEENASPGGLIFKLAPRSLLQLLRVLPSFCVNNLSSIDRFN